MDWQIVLKKVKRQLLCYGTATLLLPNKQMRENGKTSAKINTWMVIKAFIFGSNQSVNYVWWQFAVSNVGTVLNIVSPQYLFVGRDDLCSLVALGVFQVAERRQLTKHIKNSECYHHNNKSKKAKHNSPYVPVVSSYISQAGVDFSS